MRPSTVLVIGATWFELESVVTDLSDDVISDGGLPGSGSGWPVLRSGRLDGVPVVVAAGGIGKANTAAAIALVTAAVSVRGAGSGADPAAVGTAGPIGAVLQVGIGGAYPAAAGGPAVPTGAVAVAASEFDLDLGVGAGEDWFGLESLGFAAVATEPPTFNLVAVDSGLSTAVARRLNCPAVPFATSDSVTADRATAARIASRHGVMIESMEGAAAAQVCLALGLPFVEVRAVSNEVGERDKEAWHVREAIAAAATAASAALPVIYAHVLSRAGSR